MKRLLLLLIPLLVLAGCGGDESADGNGASNSSSAAANGADAPGSTEPQTHTQENALVSFARTVTPQDEPAGSYRVVVTVTAKRDLELLAVTDELPESLTVTGGNTTSFNTGMSAQDALTLEYVFQADSGTYEIQGSARAKPAGADSSTLALTSNVRVP